MGSLFLCQNLSQGLPAHTGIVGAMHRVKVFAGAPAPTGKALAFEPHCKAKDRLITSAQSP
ncbi:hypothetical protein DV532_19240 [Pseudomonas sp. Leaf58]|nr:hypothetical protein DV532_19240 [Pseudomonas sp. Leaf58]